MITAKKTLKYQKTYFLTSVFDGKVGGMGLLQEAMDV